MGDATSNNWLHTNYKMKMLFSILMLQMVMSGVFIGRVVGNVICKLCWCIDTSILCDKSGGLSSFGNDEFEGLNSSNVSSM